MTAGPYCSAVYRFKGEMKEQLNELLKPVDEIVVPAQLGWTIVSPEYDEDEKCRSLWRAPIIAWVVRLFRRSTDETTFVDVIPVTVNGDVEMQEYAIQYRDRPPFFTAFEEFDDEAALLAHFDQQSRLMARPASLTKSRQPGTGKAAPTCRSGVANA